MLQLKQPARLADILTDVSIREGSQQTIDLRNATVEVKLALLRHTVRVGVRRIELTAFAPGEWFSDSHRLAQGALSRIADEVTLRALYFNVNGLEELLTYPGIAREGIFLTAATSGYRQKNYRQRSLEHVERKMHRLISAFKSHGMTFDTLVLSSAWGDRQEPVDADEAIAYLDRLLGLAKRSGSPVYGVTLADTVGMAEPKAVGSLIRRFKSAYPEVRVTAHLHPVPQRAEACIHAAIEAGVDRWEAAWGAVGGSPLASDPGGNLDIRRLVKVYNERRLEHGLNEDEIQSTMKFLKKTTKRRIPEIQL